jgi:hypothetical protein
MIKFSAMTSDEATHAPAVAKAATPGARRPRPRRELNLFDRVVYVPIGFLWLGVLAIVAVPVMIYMTALYWIAQATRPLFGRRGARRAERADPGKRVA